MDSNGYLRRALFAFRNLLAMKTKKLLLLFLIFGTVLFLGAIKNADAAECSGECVPPTSCDADNNHVDTTVDCGGGGVCCVANNGENGAECSGECVPADSCSATENHVDTSVNCGTGGVCCVANGNGNGNGNGNSSLVCPVNYSPLAGVCIPNTQLPAGDVTNILRNLLIWILGIFGMLALLAFIISGIQYLVSAGNEDMINTAKRNMKWSVVGVIVALSAFVIIKAITAALQATSGF